MIKIPKKIAFVLMLGITIGLGVSLAYVNWENVSENNYKELGTASTCLLLSIYFMLYYVKILKEENKSK